MALADEISVKLGLSTAQFKQALKDAGADIKRFNGDAKEGTDKFTESLHGLHQAFRTFNLLLAAGGLREALGYFSDLAEAAKKSKDLVDENIDSARRWGDEWDELKKDFQGFAIQTLGFLANIGRSLGDLFSSIKGGVKNLFGPGGFIEGFRATADEINRGNIAEKQTRADMLETLKTIQERKDHEKQITAEKQKQAEAERKAKENVQAAYEFGKEIKTLDQQIAKAKYDLLTPEKQLLDLQSQRAALQKTIASKTTDEETRKKAILESTTLEKDIQEKILEILKQQADEEEKRKKTKEDMNNMDLGVLKISSGIQTYNNASDQSAYEKGLIEQTKRELQDQINEVQGQIQLYLAGGSSFGTYELPALQQRLKELQGRQQNVKSYIFDPRYQDALGRGIFGTQVQTIGDPLKLQSEQTDTLNDVKEGIDSLNTRLRIAGFGTAP